MDTIDTSDDSGVTMIDGFRVSFIGRVDYKWNNAELFSINDVLYFIIDAPTDDEDRYEYGGCDRVQVNRGKFGTVPTVEYRYYNSMVDYEWDEDLQRDVKVERQAHIDIVGSDDFFNSVERYDAVCKVASDYYENNK